MVCIRAKGTLGSAFGKTEHRRCGRKKGRLSRGEVCIYRVGTMDVVVATGILAAVTLSRYWNGYGRRCC